MAHHRCARHHPDKRRIHASTRGCSATTRFYLGEVNWGALVHLLALRRRLRLQPVERAFRIRGARYDRPDRGNGLPARLALLDLRAGAVIFDSLPHHKHLASSIRPETI